MTIYIPHALPRYGRAANAAITRPVATELRTWANLVTLIRTLAGLALFTVAAVARSLAWNLAGLAAYWSLYVLDGFPARHLGQETRFGAQFDIIGDRFLIAFFYLNYLALRPEAAVDETIWRLNWSPPGKLFNSGAVTIVLLVTGNPWATAPIMVGLYGLKLYSFVRMCKLPAPEPGARS